ncbi:protein of unknown function [Hyphomicrobium sp. MC1]|nr:protein of unknown function [Hyphomicrobium sp. MC1]
MRLRGLEPPRRFQRYHLKVVRLPIPPQPQSRPEIWEIAKGIGAAQIREDADVSEPLPERKRQIGLKSTEGANVETHYYICGMENRMPQGCWTYLKA